MNKEIKNSVFRIRRFSCDPSASTVPVELGVCSQSPSQQSAQWAAVSVRPQYWFQHTTWWWRRWGWTPRLLCRTASSSVLAELNSFSCLRKYILCGVFLMMVGSHWRSWVMVVRRKQNESNSGDEGFSQDDGQMGCVLLKVHNNLHNILVVQQQVVVAALRHQTFSLQQTHQCLRWVWQCWCHLQTQLA